ncbi:MULTISPECIES: MOSC domain-containing protein [Desulfobacula]|uniref:Molybdenum cofactor sulfurase domain protein n=2 Tax=Desulfobacula TaxID=28222 RepID=K0NTX0_DESTT|nr:MULTISPECIES: MOSC domain-containing protein [Desulfobacula]CCK82522.1 molybdenum cofactor sulfurase domain protein [Desulfobacula toluolica Tol2]SDU62231.1 MOSC domain-containing protein [Desulfobacula phenolica]
MKIVSIAVSKKKGTTKKCIQQAELIENHGIKDDAHAGDWHRQLSFLASESIEKAGSEDFKLNFGDFAENIATTGIDWKHQPIGRRFKLGEDAIVQITQIGKECHKKCVIFYRTGDCIMPKEGVFAKILKGGTIKVGDQIEQIIE